MAKGKDKGHKEPKKPKKEKPKVAATAGPGLARPAKKGE